MSGSAGHPASEDRRFVALRGPDRRLLLWTLLAAAIVRAAALAVCYDDLQADPDAYAALAQTLAESGVYGVDRDAKGDVEPSAYRPPLYPLALAWLTRHDVSSDGAGLPLGNSKLSLPAVATFHWLLGMATVLLTTQIAATVCGSASVRVRSWAAAAAGLAVAVDPILLRQSTLVMTETLATFLAVAVWASWLRCERQWHWQSAMATGGLIGLSILCRPAAAVWAGLLLGVWIAAAVRTRSRGRIVGVLAAAAATLVVWSPWVIRNAAQFGRPIAMTTHGGYTLLLANNPVLFEHYTREGPSRDWDEDRFHRRWAAREQMDLRTANAWNDPPADRGEAATRQRPPSPTGELQEDLQASEAARETIRRQPGVFLVACVYRVFWLWAPWPARGAGRLETAAVGAWYLAWYVATAYCLWRGLRQGRTTSGRGWRWRLMPGITLALSVTAVHAVYWSNMRMRSVAMPVMYVAVTSLPLVAAPRSRSPEAPASAG